MSYKDAVKLRDEAVAYSQEIRLPDWAQEAVGRYYAPYSNLCAPDNSEDMRSHLDYAKRSLAQKE